MADTPAMKVFISYSRKDRDFVARVVDALEAADGIEVFRDTDDILPTEEWQERLDQLIREADTIVFALSPHSAKSEVCAWEVELAESLHKRFAPIVIRDVEGQDIPPALARLNYIFFTNKREFDASIGNLIAALNTDIGWIREHTRLGNLARRWDGGGRASISVLRGSDLTAAESWISSQPKNAPQPTPLHHAFIQASRKAATRRQRMTVGGALAAASIATVLAGYAVIQQRAAESALRTGTESANKLVFGLAQRFENSSVPGRIIESILDEARGLQDELAANFPNDLELLHTKAAALMQLGDVYAHLDDLSKAKKAYEQSLGIRQDLLARDTSDMPGQHEQWLEDISASLNRIGNIRLSEGDTSGALAAYEESLAISRKLLMHDPEVAKWQRGLSISLNKVGETRLKQGDAKGALEVYEESLVIRRKRARAARENTQSQRDLAVSLNAIGGLRMRAGDSSGALKVYEENLKIIQELLNREPENTEWQRDLLFSLNNIGDVRRHTGDVQGALKAYEESLEVRRKLAKRDPDNTQWQRDLSVGLDRIGGIRRQTGDIAGASEAYEESLRIRRELVKRDPDNADWQHVLSFSLNYIGDIRKRTGDTNAALEAYEESLRIRRELVKRDPDNANWKRDTAVSLNNVGDMFLKTSDNRAAFEAYAESLEIARALVARDPDSVGWQVDLVIALYKTARASSNTDFQRSALEEAIRILEHLEAGGVLTADKKGWPEYFREELAQIGQPAE
ncbi:MAG: toll/interleukin-1 receptor domain-containing protein [Rhodobiaceae bacterium]|nr:toll/interleukin-1 receptor domain-containing protein [Rhodobiaceae bacterium]MCC0061111.1 toll/interleukin-1 receptor domain-containing protein [Rhodobiaceae bacterium]